MNKKIGWILGLIFVGVIVYVVYTANLKDSDGIRYSFKPIDVSNWFKEGTPY